MKILYVTLVDPFVYGGGSQATRAYLDSLIDIYGANNIDLFSWMSITECKDYESLKVIKINKNNSVLSLVLGVVTTDITRLGRPLKQYLKHNSNYDLCIINGGILAGYVVHSLRKIGIKTIVIHHNEEVEFNIDNKSRLSFGGKCSYFIRMNERKAYIYSDLNLFLTKDDLITFEKLYGQSVARKNKLIGCYDYKKALIINDVNVVGEYDFVISGSLVNYQTVTGIVDFYSKYFKIASNIINNPTILLTGRNPDKKILEIAASNPYNFKLIPDPKDIISIVAKGKIYICPINIGGGLKLRAMDGLKCGMPILVHERSARGYDFFMGKPYFKIYNDEESFKNGLLDILQFINDTSDYKRTINVDYYSYFSYAAGTERMKIIINQLYENLDL